MPQGNFDIDPKIIFLNMKLMYKNTPNIAFACKFDEYALSLLASSLVMHSIALYLDYKFRFKFKCQEGKACPVPLYAAVIEATSYRTAVMLISLISI